MWWDVFQGAFAKWIMYAMKDTLEISVIGGGVLFNGFPGMLLPLIFCLLSQDCAVRFANEIVLAIVMSVPFPVCFRLK